MKLEEIKKSKYIFWRIFICIAICLVGLFFCTWNKELKTVYNQLPYYTEVDTVEFKQSTVIEQEIYFEKSRLNTLGIGIADKTKVCNGDLEIFLFDSDDKCIWSEKRKAENLQLKTKEWFMIEQSIIPHSAYKLRIESTNLNGKILFATLVPEKNIDEISTNLFIDEQEQNTSLVIGTSYRVCLDLLTKIIILVTCALLSLNIMAFEKILLCKKNVIWTIFLETGVYVPLLWAKHFLSGIEGQNRIVYVGIVVVWGIDLIISASLLLAKCKKVEVYFLLSFFLLGGLYSLILPPFSAPDEGRHFNTAYRLSNALLGEATTDSNGFLYMRECDQFEFIFQPDNEYVIDLYEELMDPLDVSDEVVVSNITDMVHTYSVVYFPQTIGITLGRLFHCNKWQLIYLGRLINALFFATLIYVAIKIIPVGKWIIYYFAHIPIVLELSTSLSYDTLMLAMGLLIISYIVKFLSEDKKIEHKELFIYYFVSLIFVPMKYVYLWLISLIFLVDDKKISSSRKNAWIYKFFCLISGIILAIYINNANTILHTNYFRNVESVTEQTVIADSEAEKLINNQQVVQIDDVDYYKRGNIKYLLTNPLDFFEKTIESTITLADYLLFSVFGGSLGSNEIKIPKTVILMFIALYYLSLFRVNDGKKLHIGAYKKWFVISIAVAIYMSISLAFYTQTYPSRTELWGTQGRYYLLLLPLGIIFANLYGEEREENTVIIVLGTIIANLFVILNVVSTIWKR